MTNAKPDSKYNKARTYQSKSDLSFLPQKNPERGGCGEGRGVGDRNGDRDRGVAEEGEERGGGGEVYEERNGVLPEEEEVDPVAESGEDFSAEVGWDLKRRRLCCRRFFVPGECSAADQGVGGSPHEPHSHHFLYVFLHSDLGGDRLSARFVRTDCRRWNILFFFLKMEYFLFVFKDGIFCFF